VWTESTLALDQGEGALGLELQQMSVDLDCSGHD
jgi:hypothetical protein